MSQSTVLTLFSQEVYNGTNPLVIGTTVPAAGYYLGKNELQTVTWKLSLATAIIKIQATLEADPNEDDWFTIHEIVATGIDELGYQNITGNFVWIRGMITSFSSGTVQFIKLTY